METVAESGEVECSPLRCENTKFGLGVENVRVWAGAGGDIRTLTLEPNSQMQTNKDREGSIVFPV